MKTHDYSEYISSETLMGPNSIRILEELLEKNPLKLKAEDVILDLGCGKGLTSLVLAKETGANVCAVDLWIGAEENRKRFEQWGMGERITPVCEDAACLSFGRNQFRAMVSVDSYHYFAGNPGFFEEKILPFLKEQAVVLIGIPGIKNAFSGCSRQLLSDWLGEAAYMFKSPEEWKTLIGSHEQIEQVESWEMGCFEQAWDEWFATGHAYACGDKQYYESLICPYTCFVGIVIKLR